MNRAHVIQRARFTDPQFFAFFAVKWSKWAQAGFPGVDLKLLPLLERLRALPGIIPVSSCISHPERNKSKYDRTFFINLAVNEQGLETLDMLTALTLPNDSMLDYSHVQFLDPSYPAGTDRMEDRAWMGYAFSRTWRDGHTPAAIRDLVGLLERACTITAGQLGGQRLAS